MSLPPGTRLGSHEILSAISAILVAIAIALGG